MTTGNGQVLLYNLNPGLMHTEMVGSVLNVGIQDPHHRKLLASIRLFPAGGLMGYYRSEAVREFLTDFDAEWMMMVDSDIEFTLEDFYALYDTANSTAVGNGYRIASGLYVNQMGGEIKPLIYRFVTVNGVTNLIPIAPWECPLDGVVECDGAPAGFLLMHRQLLLDMQSKFNNQDCWFQGDGIFDSGSSSFGEDLAFSRRVRSLGDKIAVNCGIQLTHIKYVRLHPSVLTRVNPDEKEQPSGE